MFPTVSSFVYRVTHTTCIHIFAFELRSCESYMRMFTGVNFRGLVIARDVWRASNSQHVPARGTEN